jgi:hypothetical protein
MEAVLPLVMLRLVDPYHAKFAELTFYEVG